MPNRNDYRDIVINDKELREKIHDRKFVEEVKILTRIQHNVIVREDRKELGITHIKEFYDVGTKMYKLAHKHYGSPDYWWLIAWYNNKPTDNHFNPGDPIYVPFPLDVILSFATRED